MLDFCIISTTDHLAAARNLIRSIGTFHTDSVIHLLIPDRAEQWSPDLQTRCQLRIYDLRDVLEQESFHGSAFQYTPFELCCALKPFLLKKAIKNSKADFIVYLDGDTETFGKLDSLFNKDADIFLTPHPISPDLNRFKHYDYRAIRQAGLFNAGFVGVRRLGCETGLFLEWWCERLKFDCINDSTSEDQQGLFVDQKWLDLVPITFPRVCIMTDSTVNVGHWTLSQRAITFNEDQMLLDGEPLKIFHYSGYSKESPEAESGEVVCKFVPNDFHRTHLTDDVHEKYRKFIAAYFNRLNDALRSEDDGLVSQKKFDFSSYEDGSKINLYDRRVFLSVRKKFPNQILVDPFNISDYFKAISACEGKSDFAEFLLDENQCLILKLLEEPTRDVIIWGLNIRGRRWTEVLSACGLKITAFIDRNAPNLKGHYELPVFDPTYLRLNQDRFASSTILINATDTLEQEALLNLLNFRYFSLGNF